MITTARGYVPTGSRAGIDTLTWLIEDAFEGDPSQSLLASLRDLREEDWTALPPGGGRSVADIIMIAHDFYHAGEINHLRALLQGTDWWPYDQGDTHEAHA